MKITIEKSILENILIHANPFLEKKDTSLITSHVYLNVENDELTLKATDYEIGFIVKTKDIEIEQTGSITANGKKFLDIVKILKNNKIILEVIDETLYILQGSSKFKLPTFASNEFPSFPNPDNKAKISINSQTLIESLKKITPSIDNNNPKFELNGTLMDIQSNQIDFVSTDTKRLAIVDVKNISENELSLIIPKKAIIEIQKLFFDDLELYYDETNLIIISNQYTFFTKLINGNFPDYKRIIPKELAFSFLLPKAKMIEALKQITTISLDVKITFFEDNIIFQSLSDDNIEAKTTITHQTPFNDEFTIAINSKFLLDFLNSINSADFNIGLNSNNTPLILSDNNFKTIVMPIAL